METRGLTSLWLISPGCPVPHGKDWALFHPAHSYSWENSGGQWECGKCVLSGWMDELMVGHTLKTGSGFCLTNISRCGTPDTYVHET